MKLVDIYCQSERSRTDEEVLKEACERLRDVVRLATTAMVSERGGETRESAAKMKAKEETDV
jgi:hypothetical protein